MKRPFIFATGGTGGHIYPALALEQKLKSPVIFAGHGLEKHTYFTKGIHKAVPIPSAPLTSIRAPFILLYGLLKAVKLLRRERPKAVIGFGSYHSFPVVAAAYLLRVPIILFEPNAVLGKVNRLFASSSHQILSQFPIHPKSTVVDLPLQFTKNVTKEDAKKRYSLPGKDPIVLIFGGSLGAKVFETLPLPGGIEVIHFVGKRGDLEGVKAKYASMGIAHYVALYEHQMEYAWACADVAVTRGGALTVAEHRAMCVPTLFIPFPRASADHQYHNSMYAHTLWSGSLTLREDRCDLFLQNFKELLEKRDAFAKKLEESQTKEASAFEILEKCYIIGIGGIGMSGLARLLQAKGYPVQGSDQKETVTTGALQKEGIPVDCTGKPVALPPYAHVFYSTAIKKNHPERREAVRRRLPVDHRSKLIQELCSDKDNLLVTGTHGKTSSTALLAYLLQEGGHHPCAIIGGIAKNYGTNAWDGSGNYAAIEADESDGTFLKIDAHSAIITNIEEEHLDYYKTEKRLISAFRQFIASVKHTLVWCYDNPILQKLQPHGVSVGTHEDADVQITNVHVSEKGSTFTLHFPTLHEETYFIPGHGMHTIRNTAGVITLLKTLAIPFKKESLEFYLGVGRRIEHRGRALQADIYDDYAHHPTEVVATLEAMRAIAGKRRIVSVFQPHKYSRFSRHLEGFAKSLLPSDQIIVTDVYSSSETNTSKVHPQDLLKLMKKGRYVQKEDLLASLKKDIQQDDIVLFLGAGDIVSVSSKLMEDS